jgi:hypothetical protein
VQVMVGGLLVIGRVPALAGDIAELQLPLIHPLETPVVILLPGYVGDSSRETARQNPEEQVGETGGTLGTCSIGRFEDDSVAKI